MGFTEPCTVSKLANFNKFKFGGLKEMDDVVKIYGYARISTKDQNEDRQILALKEMGVPEKNIFCIK